MKRQCYFGGWRLITDLKIVSGKISHDCTVETERVESSIVAIKRKVVDTKALAMTLAHPTIPSNQNPNQLSYVSDVLAPSSQLAHSNHGDPSGGGLLTHPDHGNPSGGGLLTLGHGTGVQPQPSAMVQTSIKQDNASSGGQLANSEGAGLAHLRPSATMQVGSGEDNQSVSSSVTQAYATEAMSARRRESGNHYRGQSMQDVYQTSSGFHFQKAPPPTFNGNRTQWAEFRTIWQLYGARAYTTQEDRAWALKQCLEGEALTHVRAIYCNQPNAYDRMWSRLNSIYSDISMSVQQAYNDMNKIKMVLEDDVKALITFINSVENCYSQLGEVNQLSSITLSHIDDLCDKLPYSVRKDWMCRYRCLTEFEQIHPFTPFMVFLESERDIAIRLSERQSNTRAIFRNSSVRQARTHAGDAGPNLKSLCLVHNWPRVKHTMETCNVFLRMSPENGKHSFKNKRHVFAALEAT